ncbi:MAG: hypothetical protein ABI208_06195 [Ginsengibacter sp.]|jgi:hypothetical protein
MYFLNPRLAADIFDGEYIIANLDTGLYYSVQGLVVSLVSALPFEDTDFTIQSLASAFPNNADEIEQELRAVVNELLEEEIIKLDNTAEKSTNSEVIPPAEYIPSCFNRYADMQDLLLLDPIHDVDEEGWTIKKEID